MVNPCRFGWFRSPTVSWVWIPALLLCVAVLSGGCAPRPSVPVSDLSRPVDPVQVYRIVRSGDTLYSVSWAAGVDYRELAAWNGIAPPYVIRPGQRLSLVPTGRPPPAPTTGSSQTRVSALPDLGSGSARTPLESDTGAPSGSIEPPAASSTQAPAAAATVPRPRTASPTARVDPGAWRWPVAGRVVGGFGDSKGLDIAVPPGTPVRAAANGRVVYAGSGLRGYGQLVIVKHSEEYLSAYGHNRKLLVQEGDSIVSGQVLAESGSAPGKGDQVHFEIRRLGRPVDPITLLPEV